MARIAVDYVYELWSDTERHEWSALQKALRRHRGRAGGMPEDLVARLLSITEECTRSGRAYPNTPDELHETLTQETGVPA